MKINNSIDISDILDVFHETGVCLSTRTIEMSGEINVDFYTKHIKNIHFLDNYEQGIIHIKLNSEGGDVAHAFAIYDAIKSCKNYVRIIGYGEVYSAASIILQAADERILTEHSKLMIHIGEEGYGTNHPRNIDGEYKLSKVYEKQMEDVYLNMIKVKKPRFTRKQLKELLTFDSYMCPSEAIDIGLADRIGDTQ